MSMLAPARPSGPSRAARAARPAPTSDQDGTSRRWLLEVALVLVTIAAAAGLHRSFRGWGSNWVGPVFLTLLGTHLVCRLTRRHIRSPAIGALVDLLAVGLLTVWTVIPASTDLGVPASHTWRTVVASMDNLAGRFDNASAPVIPDASFMLLAVAGAGTLALLGTWLAFRLGRVMAALIPGFAGFIVCSTIGTRSGRGWSTVLEVAVLTAYLLVERATQPRPPGVAVGRATRRPSKGHVAGGIAIGFLAVAVALFTIPRVSGPDGHGPLGWNELDKSSTRIVISPLVSLRTRLIDEPKRPVLVVRSSQPSYWRLTSLDTFNGVQWNAGDTYEGVDRDLPGVTDPAGSRQVTESFDIEDLYSPWAPLAFDPETITGAGKVSYDPRSGSLLTPHPTSNGLHYTVTSVQYLADLSAKKLIKAPALDHASPPAGYLQLPKSIPARVRRLAERIIKGDKTEYAKALALQAFFHTSEFTYSLDPPSDGTGTATLYNFLFSTHTGYCQQFAGSFAVLARLVGLPTRLAVGFTTGALVGPDTYQVTDADAHTWPEVWFPTYGWVPFEPTQGPAGQGFAIPGAAKYTGNTTITTPIGPKVTTVPTTVAPTDPNSPTTTSGVTGTSVPPVSTPGNIHIHSQSGGAQGSSIGKKHKAGPRPTRRQTPALLIGLTVIALAATTLALANELRRRQRWRRRRTRHVGESEGARGAAATMSAWEEVQETLAWHGLRRSRSETFRELAERVATHHEFDRRGPGRGAPADELRRLAYLAGLATYTGTVPAELVVEAELAAIDIRADLRIFTTPAQRLRLLLDPRLSWVGPRTSSSGPSRVEGTKRPVNPWASPFP